ncbi:MAG: hypothetical protein D6676_08355, partial [Cyanobacteria bacterium J003]
MLAEFSKHLFAFHPQCCADCAIPFCPVIPSGFYLAATNTMPPQSESILKTKTLFQQLLQQNQAIQLIKAPQPAPNSGLQVEEQV